jgi:hypothetical protein
MLPAAARVTATTPSHRHEHVVYESPQFRAGARAPAVGRGLWQNRRLGEFAPSWDPAGDHSPNTLFAASFAQEGFALDIPSPETYYRFLPEHHVKRIYRRGVKVKGSGMTPNCCTSRRALQARWPVQATLGHPPRTSRPTGGVFPGARHTRVARPALDGPAAGR